MNWNTSFFELINQYAGKSVCLDSLAIFFAEYLQYVLVFIFVILLIKNFDKYLPLILRIVAAGILARIIITEIIRLVWERPRPFIENNVNLILEHSPLASFPSGHASLFFAVSTVIYLYNKKAGILFFIASFLISISRVFAGIHWPADIIAGALVGIFSGWLIVRFLKQS
ncbi:MAG: phosphatase PAP2 family protein [bacterium]